MVRLSVNINKFATLRNARGGKLPDVLKAAQDCERFGAQGITVHPRPDERHIRKQDVLDLKPMLTTEFNIEGYPSKDFIQLIKKVQPAQCTLVPDSANVITSNQGWDTIANESLLKEVIDELKTSGCRVSVFVDPIEQFIEGAKKVGADRIELYTGPYAHNYLHNKEKAVEPYRLTAKYADKIGLGVNAGHDLNLHNLKYLKEQIPSLAEVSIGHALICDAIYFGLENTIQMYLQQLDDYRDKE